KYVLFDVIPLGSADLTSGSVPHLAHLFDKAEKTGQKENYDGITIARNMKKGYNP
ncbi:5369_t:CDS:1, partial [Funneliformis geosporum]